MVEEALGLAVHPIVVPGNQRVAAGAEVVILGRVQSAKEEAGRRQCPANSFDQGDRFQPLEIMQGETGDDDRRVSRRQRKRRPQVLMANVCGRYLRPGPCDASGRQVERDDAVSGLGQRARVVARAATEL